MGRPRLVATVGLPASGKTTWAKKIVLGFPGQYKRINKDDLRSMFDASKWTSNNEKFILDVRDTLITKALGEKMSVIVDDTNLAPKHIKRLKELAENMNAVFETKSFYRRVGARMH